MVLGPLLSQIARWSYERALHRRLGLNKTTFRSRLALHSSQQAAFRLSRGHADSTGFFFRFTSSDRLRV